MRIINGSNMSFDVQGKRHRHLVAIQRTAGGKTLLTMDNEAEVELESLDQGLAVLKKFADKSDFPDKDSTRIYQCLTVFMVRPE